MSGRSFTWRNWAGSDRRLAGVASVAFEPAHVVFRDAGDRILLAPRNEQVNDLREVLDEDCARG